MSLHHLCTQSEYSTTWALIAWGLAWEYLIESHAAGDVGKTKRAIKAGGGDYCRVGTMLGLLFAAARSPFHSDTISTDQLPMHRKRFLWSWDA